MKKLVLHEEAEQKLNDYIEKYCDYRQKGEYGTSAFWNWVYQIKHQMEDLLIKGDVGQNKVYQMVSWGKIVYNKHMVDGEAQVIVREFRFNKTNFHKWLRHKSLRRNPYIKVRDAGYGYTIVQHDETGKRGILTPKGKRLTQCAFDEVIGFEHFDGYKKEVTAAGFIDDRVYAIAMDGYIWLRHMSVEEFLAHKRIDDSFKRMVRRKVRQVLTEYARTYPINTYQSQRFIWR